MRGAVAQQKASEQEAVWALGFRCVMKVVGFCQLGFSDLRLVFCGSEQLQHVKTTNSKIPSEASGVEDDSTTLIRSG